MFIMDLDLNYLEEFLLSAQEKLEGLKFYKEPDNENYKYFVVEFNGDIYKIEKGLALEAPSGMYKIN